MTCILYIPISHVFTLNSHGVSKFSTCFFGGVVMGHGIKKFVCIGKAVVGFTIVALKLNLSVGFSLKLGG